MTGMSAYQGMKIALDVMSGDESPRSRICAVNRLLKRRTDLHLILVGDESLIASCLSDYPNIDCKRLNIVHADKTVAMSDRPSRALRSKKGSSMWKALELVADGRAEACVSAGNTGALMAMGRYLLKTFPGVDRPAIATCIPCRYGKAVLLDIGANVDSSSASLYQFAVMGSQLASSIYDVVRPKVALLNVGTEEIKGSEQVRLAHQQLQNDELLNYIGYIEGHNLFTGQADVIVCDGFAGNIALKTAEGVANLVRDELLAGFKSCWWRRLIAVAVAPVLKEFGQRVDPVLYNGASLLGLQGIVVKSHGGADEKGFYQAICQAVREVERDVPVRLAAGVEDMLMR